MQGWAVPLDEVPDPVFAERMMGDGVAIDPTGDCLHAPCDATVLGIHASGHAVTLRSPEGAEILMHIGLDTVALGGRGFTPQVTEGVSVARGDPLIRFDLDLLVREARAVVTPIVVTNPDRFAVQRRECGRMVGMGEALMTLIPIDAAGADTPIVDGETVRRTVRVPLVHGIHARPAARIGEAGRRFVASIAIDKDGRSASVRSPVGLMALGIRLDDEVTVVATGPDAADAVAAVADLIRGGMGEVAGHAAAPVAAPVVLATKTTIADDGRLTGVTAAPGIAIGQAGLFRLTEINVARRGSGVAGERTALDEALAAMIASLADRSTAASATERTILDAHAAMLADPALTGAAHAAVACGAQRRVGVARRDAGAGGRRCGRSATRGIAERADDLIDLERQVLANARGRGRRRKHADAAGGRHPAGRRPAALATAGAGARADRGRRASAGGGPTSHVAILAAAMGMPALVAAGPALPTIAEGTPLILDARRRAAPRRARCRHARGRRRRA